MRRRHPEPDLFAALQARDGAMERVEENAPDDWKGRAMEAIRRVCLERADFIVDDVWEYVDRPPEARAMGPMVVAAASRGWCEAAGEFRKSAQPQCHANPRSVWRSLLWRAPEQP